MPFAAVLFDNDGLTLDTEPAWTRAETKLFARHGSTFTMEHKRSLLGTAPPVAAAKLEAMLGVPGDVLNAELHELVLVEVAAGIEPMPGAVDLLSALRAAGIPVGLVSNSPRSFVERGLRSAGLEGAFAVLVTGEEVARPKPAPDAYVAAAGRAAGALTIGVPSVPGVTLEADVVAASLADPAVWLALGLEAAAA